MLVSHDTKELVSHETELVSHDSKKKKQGGKSRVKFIFSYELKRLFLREIQILVKCQNFRPEFVRFRFKLAGNFDNYQNFPKLLKSKVYVKFKFHKRVFWPSHFGGKFKIENGRFVEISR